MGVLIPRDLASAPYISRGDVHVGEALASALPDDVWVWYSSPRNSKRPRFLALSPQHGLVCIDVCDWSPIDVEAVRPDGISVAGGHHHDPLGELGRRIEALRNELARISPPPAIKGFLAFPNFNKSELETTFGDQYLPRGAGISGDGISNGYWQELIKTLPDPMTPQLIEDIRSRLYPETLFQRARLVHDEDTAKRKTLRLQLDTQQEDLARSLGSGVTLLSGVCGSGKSLVLAARAKLLSSEYSDWKIQVLCFNRSLVGYLQELIGDQNSRIQIDTFFAWARRLGIRLPVKLTPKSQAWLDKQIENAIARGVGVSTYDAVLVDEGQDFAQSWLRLAHKALKPDRGGMIIAVDMAQCIYRKGELNLAFDSDQVGCVSLTKNYRNTEQIGRFAIPAVFGLDTSASPSVPSELGLAAPAAPDFVVGGEPVHMVWAESWDQQAAFVAKQISHIVAQRRAAYRDIAILYTQRKGTVRRILPALEQEKIPYYWANRDHEAKGLLDMTENSVKIMTVHSGKGLEFPVVFLMAVEALRIPDTIEGADEEDANRIRLAYVGMTRAQDTLYLTYTRSNPIIDRALDLESWSETLAYPEDFDFTESPPN